MARFWYQLSGDPDVFNVYADPTTLDRADMEAYRDFLLEVQGASDAIRIELAMGSLNAVPGIGPQQSLQDFDDLVQDELDRYLDILDYYDYDTRQQTLTVRDGAWITPIAIESVSHENVGEEATLAIDGDFGTWWQSDASGTREIVFELRSYPKKIERLRVRAPASDLRAQLQGVTIKAAKNINMIDDPRNWLDTDIDLTYTGNIWLEHTLTTPKFNARFMKLECATSLFVANPEQVRIREIEVRVGTRNHEN